MNHRSRLCTIESLQDRHLLSAVPFGAAPHDVAEFLLGEVAVNVVFLESNGAIDADTEQWTPELASGVKQNIEEGLDWWKQALAKYSDVHQLEFVVDYTFADTPVETSYEPISRGSQDFVLWIEEFFRQTELEPAPGFAEEIRTFNHQQRLVHDSNWSFTIFVVNSDNDPNGRFGDENAQGTVFQRAFGFPGGQFFVMPHHRPPATVAHELAHMFWAFDEYSNGDHYTSRRGYYATQNTNGLRGNPNPDDREPSIMASTGAPFANFQVSQAARETLGWRDSDGDGIFDVLDVPHELSGTATFNPLDRSVQFAGQSTVQTLENRNPSGTGNDMTLNRITDLQYRVDEGEWQDLQSFDDYSVSFSATTPAIPLDANHVEFRTTDAGVGVHSNLVRLNLSEAEPATRVLQNPDNPLDVSGDGHVTAIDALQVIIFINEGNSVPDTDGPPYLDVSGDAVITSRDVLMVINHINTRSAVTSQVVAAPPAPDAEPPEPATVLAPVSATKRDPLELSPFTSAVLSLFSSNLGGSGEPDFWSDEETGGRWGEVVHA